MSSVTPKIPLTQEEQTVYGSIFSKLDEEQLGVVTGEAVRSTLEKSGLPPVVLGEIWQLADQENLGFLTQPAFGVALRLIGHVQHGAPLDKSLIDRPGPIATFTGAAPPAVIPSTMTGGISPAGLQPLAPQSTSLPPLTNHDISKFSQLFAKNAPTGVISGNQARSIFMKAKLPTKVLGQIWALADRNNAGQLTRDEFVVAMYLIQGSINGSIKQLPPTLPSYVWDQVKAFQSPLVTGSTASFSPQQTGAIPTSVTGSRVPSSFASAPPSNTDWTITPQKRAQFDNIFAGLDKNGKGVLGPDEVAPFLMNSKLPQDVLATVWDLADIHNTGEFTKDEFAIAMFLIQKKIAGCDLPDVVPDSLLPQSHPALQYQNTASAAPVAASPVTQPVAAVQQQPTRPQIPSRETKPKSSLNDLVDLNDAFSTPSPQPSDSRNVSQSTVQSQATVQYTPTGSAAPKPFAPSSSFGQTLMEKQRTGVPAPVAAPVSTASPVVEKAAPQPPQARTTQSFPPPPSAQPQSNSPFPAPPSAQKAPSSTPSFSSGTAAAVGAGAAAFGGIGAVAATATGSNNTARSFPQNDDLLAESNPEISGKLSQATTDMANLSTQIGSLTSQTTQLHDKRTRAEKELAKITSLKQDIEAKLSKLRIAYDQEVKQTEQVESLLASSRQETEQLRQQASVAEAQYNQVQTQLQGLQAELQESQNENASLKERLGTLNAEQIEMNKELERVQQEVKQSKGLVAINSKQLNVAEVKSTGIREEIDALLSSVKELDSHHEVYTQKQADLELTKKQIEEFEQNLSLRQQQYAQADADFLAKEQELNARIQQQQQREAMIQQQEEQLQQHFANLQERQRQHQEAEAQLEQQQVDYAQRIQQFTEKQINDVTSGYGTYATQEHTDRDLDAQDKSDNTISKGSLAGAIGAVGAAGAAAFASTKSESERGNTEFSSPVATNTERTTSLNSEDQYPAANQFQGLDLQRPQSATSSVQNNAPQSVRGDDIEETTNIDSIVEEPALAADVLSKDYNTSAPGVPAEDENSGAGSFELVDSQKSEEEETRNDTQETVPVTADTIEQTIPGAWAEPTIVATEPTPLEPLADEVPVVDEVPDVEAPPVEIPETIPEASKEAVNEIIPTSETVAETTKSVTETPLDGAPIVKDEFDDLVPAEEKKDEFDDLEPASEEPTTAEAFTSGPQTRSADADEFPPIQELDIDESDSDDDEIFHETSENVVRSPGKADPTESPLVNAAASLDAFSGMTPAVAETDAFDEFDGLEEAKEDAFDDEDLDQQNFNGELDGTTFFGADGAAQQSPHGEEEWEQIFAGFGNQPGQQHQPQQFATPEEVKVPTAASSVPPRIATTPRSLAVQELTGMGFTEEEALKALEKEKWNLEAATNYLLDNA